MASFALHFLALLTPCTAVSVREAVTFDYSWRHRLGLHKRPPSPPPPGPPPVSNCSGTNPFPDNATGVECTGLGKAAQGDKSADACEKACCADGTCSVWQWSEGALPAAGCWMGSPDEFPCPNPGNKWVGGRREPPIPPPVTPPVNPDPGANPAEAQPAYDDSDWNSVMLPHDGLIAQAPSIWACPQGCSGRSYIPRHVMWYRKNFTIPSDWAGSAVWLDFQGVFREATVYINGVNVSTHVCGYTPFRIRLDNLSSVVPAGKGQNTIALFVDPDNGDGGSRRHGSGWWYEGGGIYRHVNLVKANYMHVAQDGLFAYANVSLDGISHGETPREGAVAASAVLHVSAEIQNDVPNNASGSFCGNFYLIDTRAGGKIIASASIADPVTVPSGGTATAQAQMSVKNVNVWTIQNPYLYTVVFNATAECKSGAEVVDTVSTTTGFRSLRYNADQGFFLNEKHFKVRGFCDHNNLAVVGMAVPDRLNLFRAQASRAVGGNGRRTSHNPPNPEMLDIYDRIGVVVMDENRLFENKTAFVNNMGSMVKRDRNHPSVVIWSFCNEAGCEGTNENGGPRFYDISYRYDGSRPTLANMFTFADLLSDTIDVQGFSHQSRDKLDQCHAKLPNKPIFMSECCSCNTMRDEDVGCESSDGPSTCVQKSFNADCVQGQTNASNGADYAIGTMVWTLFDYYGEPSGGWPHASSTFGQFDLAGFPKAAAWWYRAYWLNRVPDASPDKTFTTGDDHFVYIVESWESPDSFPATKGNKTRNITVYSDVDFSFGGGIELFVNGESQGSSTPVNPTHENGYSWAYFNLVPWTAGNLTAVATDGSGDRRAASSRFTSGAAVAIRTRVDCPSAATGTGTALLLDGQDAGMVRAEVVDASGRVVHMASNNVTFRVVSGPGVVVGAANGDPSNHDPHQVPWREAYHGLVRAVVKVTDSSALYAAAARRIHEIDGAAPAMDSWADDDEIVIEASAPGLQSSRVSIPVSRDVQKDSVMAVATAAAGQPVSFFG